MGGLYKVFTKILPIMMLICFISFGILHTFSQVGQGNPTFLSTETINIGTEEEPDNKTLYTFDMKGYTENISVEPLKDSISNTIDVTTYERVLNKFNYIWKDGYQFLDGIRTIINGVLLVIDTIITSINIVILPLRITAAIILTGMAIIGINISRDTTIIKGLKAISQLARIPLIQPSYPSGATYYYQGDVFLFKNSLNFQYFENTPSAERHIDIKFITQDNKEWNRINIIETRNPTTWKINFQNTNNYDSINDRYETIYIYDTTTSGWYDTLIDDTTYQYQMIQFTEIPDEEQSKLIKLFNDDNGYLFTANDLQNHQFNNMFAGVGSQPLQISGNYPLIEIEFTTPLENYTYKGIRVTGNELQYWYKENNNWAYVIAITGSYVDTDRQVIHFTNNNNNLTLMSQTILYQMLTNTLHANLFTP